MTGEYDPADGSVGYLTWDQWDRLTRAWVTARKHLPWWWVAGHVRGGDADELRRRSREPALPLPATWLAAHEITRLMQELNRWGELEDAANDVDGAEFALLLVREVETAAARWPLADRSHKVKFFRCPACDQMTLRYLPPNTGERPDAPMVDVKWRTGDELRTVRLMDVVVRCTDAACGAVMDHSMFELAVALIWQEQEARSGKRRLAVGGSGGGEVSEVGEDDSALGEVGSGGPVEAGAGMVLQGGGSGES